MRSLTLFLALLLLPGCGGGDSEPLVVYSGRSNSLVDPLIEIYRDSTGRAVEVRYGDTAQLAVALSEEGDQTTADVFWAQDAGALGAAHRDSLLAELPDSILRLVPDHFRNDDATWVATSGRARTLAYSPERADTSNLPRSIFQLSEPRFRGRVGWAPTNGSFQAHVTAIRTLVGDDSTRAWLEAMKNNGTKSYRNNTAIVQAIANGDIDLGLPNHYYLYRFKSEDPDFPVEQTFFAEGDAGNLINIAGAGILSNTDQEADALLLLEFLLSTDAQQYFSRETYEYPVIDDVTVDVQLPAMNRLNNVSPSIDLDRLEDLEATLQLLREVELL
jgi:iron(III) transport system substrate-binding protein